MISFSSGFDLKNGTRLRPWRSRVRAKKNASRVLLHPAGIIHLREIYSGTLYAVAGSISERPARMI